MATVDTIEAARACVDEGAIALAEHRNQHGRTVYAVCLVPSDVVGLENSPYVDPDTVVWHYRDGVWIIKPPDDEQ